IAASKVPSPLAAFTVEPGHEVAENVCALDIALALGAAHVATADSRSILCCLCHSEQFLIPLRHLCHVRREDRVAAFFKNIGEPLCFANHALERSVFRMTTDNRFRVIAPKHLS